MEGELPDFQPCHRIDAARLLVKLGFDQAQAAIDHAAPPQRRRRSARAQTRFPRPASATPQRQAESESHSATNSIRAQLAQIVREETGDGYITVQFLIDAMQGEFPDFKPCHRLSAAKELLQRGFDYLPEDADARAVAEPEPVELTPEELEAQRHAELLEFSKHGPVYYKNYPYPCVCEDRLHDCEGNPLTDAAELEAAARRAPTMEHLIIDRDRLEDFLARYAEYLKHWNAEHPRQSHRLQPPPMDQPPLAGILRQHPRPLAHVAPPPAACNSQLSPSFPRQSNPSEIAIRRRRTALLAMTNRVRVSNSEGWYDSHRHAIHYPHPLLPARATRRGSA